MPNERRPRIMKSRQGGLHEESKFCAKVGCEPAVPAPSPDLETLAIIHYDYANETVTIERTVPAPSMSTRPTEEMLADVRKFYAKWTGEPKWGDTLGVPSICVFAATYYLHKVGGVEPAAAPEATEEVKMPTIKDIERDPDWVWWFEREPEDRLRMIRQLRASLSGSARPTLVLAAQAVLNELDNGYPGSDAYSSDVQEATQERLRKALDGLAERLAQ